MTAVLRINGQYSAFIAEEAGQGRQGGEGQAGRAGKARQGAAGRARRAGGLVARQRPVTLGPIVGDNYAVLSGIA